MSTPDTPRIRNRVTELLGVEIPIVQAPMGGSARSQLASAVSNAGGMGIIETSSGELDAVREEILKLRDLTDQPFGVNIAQMFVRDPKIVDFVVDQGVRFVTTSAGNPMQYTQQLKQAGLTVFHVIPTLRTALKAIAAGVAQEATSLGMELLGSVGARGDHLIEKLYRDAKAMDIVEGTGQIQRMIMARHLVQLPRN